MARLVELGKLKSGEDILAEHLCESLSDDYLVITSFNVGREVDIAVLAPQALFVLEAKHWKGRIQGSDNGVWTQITPIGETITHPNPLDQISDTWKGVGNFLKGQLPNFSSWVQGILVFTHPNCERAWSLSFRDEETPALLLEETVPFIESFPPRTRIGVSPLTPENYDLIEKAFRGILTEQDRSAYQAAVEIQIDWDCPKCGIHNSGARRFCSSCGLDYSEFSSAYQAALESFNRGQFDSAITLLRQTLAKIGPKPASDDPTCRAAEALLEKAKHAKEQEVRAEIGLCPVCHAYKNPRGTQFCGNCGADLYREALKPAIRMARWSIVAGLAAWLSVVGIFCTFVFAVVGVTLALSALASARQKGIPSQSHLKTAYWALFINLGSALAAIVLSILVLTHAGG
jgi:hypothetical protein